MFISEANYSNMKLFLTGYLLGLEDSMGINFNKDFSDWLNKKYHTKSSLFWTEYIYLLIATKDEKQAYNTMLKLIKDFINDSLP
jgi:hypothetical protein